MLTLPGQTPLYLFFPRLPVGTKYLAGDRRVKDRQAIVCDALGAIDALVTTGTLICRGRRLTPSVAMLPVSPV